MLGKVIHFYYKYKDQQFCLFYYKNPDETPRLRIQNLNKWPATNDVPLTYPVITFDKTDTNNYEQL